MKELAILLVLFFLSPWWYPVLREILLDIREAARSGGARGKSTMLRKDRAGGAPHHGSRRRWVNPGWDTGRRVVKRGNARRTGFAREARSTSGPSAGFREPGT